ncbi:MAG: hypothetical protein DYG92_03525 [Leptolyngbya sp. PLA1]|nr:hypothetical protein [Leptolyngbya sp. PLA1]
MHIALASVVAALQISQPGGEPLGVQPPPGIATQPAGTPRRIESAEDLLRLIEDAEGRFRTLSADVLFDQVKGVDADRRKRFGKIWFEDGRVQTPPGPRRFAVRFDRVQFGSRIQDEVQEYIFDGQWMVERRPAEKQIIKQQVARPGENSDPLRLGEGRFPLPIGQKAAAIRERYTVELLAPEVGLEAHDEKELPALQKFVAGTHQLKLVPVAGLIETEELKEIRLWYRAEVASDGLTNLLPRLARTVNRAGDVTIVQMINVALNLPVPPDVLSTVVPEGWDAQVRELPPVAPPTAPTGR